MYPYRLPKTLPRSFTSLEECILCLEKNYGAIIKYLCKAVDYYLEVSHKSIEI